MPWINGEDCDCCGICVDECPVDKIVMKDEEAEINMDGCIRCGVCHDICPQDAVRHDGEKTTERIDSNVETTKRYMELCAKYLGDEKEKLKCLNRMIKHFTNQKIIAEKTRGILEKLKKEI
ncbi:MAG: 4Fe-4S dicluster domain-containing protein [Deltaproteobacteria bacterium]|nr:4Fe-4S dicluster domain-containing protein [Deltaproteobacteria bacterium]